MTVLPPMAESAEPEDRPGADHDWKEDYGGTAKEDDADEEDDGFFGANFHGIAEECWCGGCHPSGSEESADDDIILKPICNVRRWAFWMQDEEEHDGEGKGGNDPAERASALA
jgi:hypothetical protein